MPKDYLAVFRSRQHAIRAESLLQHAGIGAHVIQTPPETGLPCDLAVIYPADRTGQAMQIFRAQGMAQGISGVFYYDAQGGIHGV
nr:DUF3343 domain-containing protein [bacterium]